MRLLYRFVCAEFDISFTSVSWFDSLRYEVHLSITSPMKVHSWFCNNDTRLSRAYLGICSPLLHPNVDE